MLDLFARERAGRLGSLALLFSLIATLLALPAGFQTAKDSLFPTKWSTGFRTIDPLRITYDAGSGQLRVDITSVALNEGKEQDTIDVQGAVLGKQLSDLQGSFSLDDPQPPFPVDPSGVKSVTIKGHALFGSDAAAKALAGEEQTLWLSFKGLEGNVTNKICIPLSKDDLAKITAGTALQPFPTDCNGTPAAGH